MIALFNPGGGLIRRAKPKKKTGVNPGGPKKGPKPVKKTKHRKPIVNPGGPMKPHSGHRHSNPVPGLAIG